MAAITPSLTATSAGRRGEPVPSTTVPFLISKSYDIMLDLRIESGGLTSTKPAAYFVSCPRLVQVHPIELDGIVANNLAPDALADMSEVPGDYPLRTRPGGIGVRKIRRPHELVFTEVAAGQGRHRVVLEGCPQMAAQVVARQHLDPPGLHHAEEFFVDVIETMEVMCDPPGVVLG